MSALESLACHGCARSFATHAERRQHQCDSGHESFLTARKAAEVAVELARPDDGSMGVYFLAMWMAGYGPDENGQFLIDLVREKPG